MFKKLFLIAVLCTTFMGIFLINANALFTGYNIWGMGWLNPIYIDHWLRGGVPPGADATIDTTITVLEGDLVLRGPAGQLVLGGVGFSEPALVSTTFEGIEPDENGNYFLRQFLPRRPEDCDWTPPGSTTSLNLCGGTAGTDPVPRFLAFWNIDPNSLKNNYQSIEEIRIELGEVTGYFHGDNVKGEFDVYSRFKACLDLRDEIWPDSYEYILQDPSLPIACDDAYVSTANKPLKIPAPGPLYNDYDHEGDVLAVTEVNGIPVTPGFETTTEGGTLRLYENGKFIYTPNTDFDGDDSFSYVNADSNGNLSNEAIVTITVVPK